MRRLLTVVATVLLVGTALAFSAVEQVRQPDLAIQIEEKNPWTHLGLKNRPENFQFAIVTDRTGGHRRRL